MGGEDIGQGGQRIGARLLAWKRVVFEVLDVWVCVYFMIIRYVIYVHLESSVVA